MVNLLEVFRQYPALSRRLTCGDLLFTHYECPQRNRKERTYLEYNLIVYVISGRRIFHRNNRQYEMTEGVCMFIKKGTQISERPGDEGWCAMGFFLPDGFIKGLMNENLNKLPAYSLPGAQDEDILNLHINDLTRSFFSSMIPYFTMDPSPPENLVELKFKELVLSILADTNNGHLLSYFNWLREGKLPALEEIMEKNFTANLTIEEYSYLACRSTATFKREFKKLFHTTPAKWIMKRRVRLARELLENTSMTVGEIAFEVGFESHQHFSRAFKEHIGATPSQWRLQRRTVTPTIRFQPA